MPTLAVGIDARQATVGGRIAARAIGQLRKQTVLLQQQQKLLSAQFVKTGAAAKTGGMGMRGMMGGMMGIAGIFKAVQGWSKFDTSMRRIQGVIGGSDGVASQMKALSATARQLGAATSFTASEAADGMLMLSRAGMSAGEVVAATGAVLDLAKVAAIGLQQSATLTADSLKQFGMDASQAREAADTLAFAANNSNTDITQLGEGLKMSGPLAAAAGMSLADTSVILGLLADSGLKATLGGTGVRAMLASLGDPSTEAAAALSRLGIDVDTLTEKIQTQGGLREVMSKLGPDVMGVTDAIRIFSRRGAAAALIMGKSTKRWKDFDDRMKNSDGTVRKSAKLIEEGLGDAFKQLGSAIAEANLVLGEGGLGFALKSTVQWLTEGVRALTDWSVAMTRAGATAALFIGTAALGGLLAILAKIVIGFKKAKATAGSFFALLAAHPIMLAVTAIGLLGTAMIRMSSRSSFASEELVKLDRTIKGMTENLDNLTLSWGKAVEFGDINDQIQALSGMRGMVDKLAQAQFELPEGGMIAAQMFDEIRDALAKVNIKGFFTHTGDTSQAPAAASMQAVQKTWQRETGSKERKVLGMDDFVTERGDPRGEVTREDALAQAKRVLDLLTARMDELRDSMSNAADEAVKAVATKTEEMTAMEALRGEHVRLTDDYNLQQYAAKASDREIANLNDGLQIMDRLAKATGLSHEELAVKYKDELRILGQLVQKKNKKNEEEELAATLKAEKEAFADTIGRAVVDPLIDGLMTGDFRQVGQAMYMNLMSAILEEMVAKPMMKAIVAAMGATPAPAALGGAYVGGVQRFARGGVVGNPTTFGMAGGRTGLMGEAGPEAIMPLKRGANGKLGVVAQGGGTTVNDNRTINIQVQDDAGFRRTMRQLDRDTAQRIDKGMK